MPDDIAKLIERLRVYAEDWRTRAASNDVVVEAATALSGLVDERDALEGQVDALAAKIQALAPHGTCACDYDAPGDVCAHHSPRLLDALDRAEQAERERDEARAALAALSARFNRLNSAVSKFRWLDEGVLATENTSTKQGLDEVAEFLFADGIDSALQGGKHDD